jgi:hypothetical protein
MPIFKVNAKVTVSCFTEVEAETEEEAIELASERGLAECHIDGSFPVDESWHYEADGSPYDLRVDGQTE